MSAPVRLENVWRTQMALTIIRVPAESPKKPKKHSGHTKAAPPTISLDQPGRLRVANLLSILGISHSTLYTGLETGRYPKPDGKDGRMPWWSTTTIRDYLDTQTQP